jgi:hypothetical protein
MILDSSSLQRMLDDAARRGAEEALARIGLHDESSAKDIGDLRDLLSAWREVRSTAIRTSTKVLTTIIIGAVLVGLGIKLEVQKWLN